MKSVYFIFGEEKFLVRQELERVIAEHPGAEKENLSEISPEGLLERIFLPSLFAPAKIFIVRDFDFSKDRDNKLAELSQMPPGTAVVFVDPGIDRRTKWFRAIEGRAEVIECRKIPQWDEEVLLSWIVSQAGRLGKTVDRDAAGLMVEYLGFEMSAIFSELEKLAVYTGDNKEITGADVKRMVPRTGFDAFSLSDALLARDRKRSHAALEKLFSDREDPIKLVGLLAAQFRTLYKVKLLMRGRSDRQNIARTLKASPYYVGKMMAAADNFDSGRLEGSIEALHRADLRLKSGYDQKVEMTLLLSELLSE